jgi:hypothetical protein
MMRNAALVLLAALMVAPVNTHAAQAPPGKVETAFGNTLLTIDPDGRSRKIWLSPDGTWTGLSRRGLDLAGTWKMKGEKVCLSQSKPALPGRLCWLFPPDLRVGGAATKDTSGKTGALKLVKGHVTQ